MYDNGKKPSIPSLDQRLESILRTRQERNILRRLPGAVPEGAVDFYTNDYLSLSHHPRLQERFFHHASNSGCVGGSGGSRLLVNSSHHSRLEERLRVYFGSESALLFNSGFDANVGFFSCIPGDGDVVIYDEYIHASVHDGMRSSRAKNALLPFRHNCLSSFRRTLQKVVDSTHPINRGTNSVFIAVEALYSMDGDFAPLREIVEIVEELLPMGNGHIVVDEAHSTGIYGHGGRGLVSLLGLEDRITARLHTFGKALASNGAVLVTRPIIKSFLVNYARPLIYTTALGHAALASVEASFDLLEDGTAAMQSEHLFLLFRHFLRRMREELLAIDPTLLSIPKDLDLPSPIIPVLTSKARPLASYLSERGIVARPITWPTVPKGADRLRVCLHGGNNVEEVDKLIVALITWARKEMRVGAGLVEAKL